MNGVLLPNAVESSPTLLHPKSTLREVVVNDVLREREVQSLSNAVSEEEHTTLMQEAINYVIPLGGRNPSNHGVYSLTRLREDFRQVLHC